MKTLSSIPPVETRGITVYLPPDATRREILERVERYVKTGFNFLVLKVFTGGRVLYPSEVTAEALGIKPRHLKKRNDPVAMLLEATRMHGLPVYAGFELLEHHMRQGDANPLRDEHGDWFVPEDWPPMERQLSEARRELAPDAPPETVHWMLPLHADARRYLGSLIVEAISAYPFDGIYFDRLTFPSVVEEDDLENKATRTIRRRLAEWMRTPLDPPEVSDDELAITTPVDVGAPISTQWNDWFSAQLLSFANYLRQRIYKARPHIVMMMEIQSPSTKPGETAIIHIDSSAPGMASTPASPDNAEASPTTAPTPDKDNAGRDGANSLEAIEQHPALELPWRESLIQVLEMLAPRYDIRGAPRLESLDDDFRLMGLDSPLLPVLNLQVSDLDPRPFEQIRRSSALGFLIDAGRPLFENQWRFFEELLDEPAMSGHNNPAEAVNAVVEHTQSLLPESHDLVALLNDLHRILENAGDTQEAEKTRDSVIKNLVGLIDMAGEGKLELPADPVRWQVLRNLGLLIRLQAMIQSRGQMLRATPFFSEENHFKARWL